MNGKGLALMAKYKIMYAVVATAWRIVGRDAEPTTDYFIRSVHDTSEAAYAARMPEDSIQSFITPELKIGD